MTRGSMLIKHAGISYAIKFKDILFVESSNKKVIVHFGTKRLDYCGKLGMFETIPAFFRCHRCYVVNMAHILSYCANEVVLISGDKIIMSRRRYAAFVKAYSSLIL